jgi:hypothetical protein
MVSTTECAMPVNRTNFSAHKVTSAGQWPACSSCIQQASRRKIGFQGLAKSGGKSVARAGGKIARDPLRNGLSRRWLGSVQPASAANIRRMFSWSPAVCRRTGARIRSIMFIQSPTLLTKRERKSLNTGIQEFDLKSPVFYLALLPD